MTASFVRYVDAGVDYLTCTITSGESARRMVPVLQSIVRDQRELGERERPWSMSGYQGFCCGGVQAGRLGGVMLVRLSGPVAYTWWRTFARVADNCSRLDLQVTVEYTGPPSLIIANHYRQIKRFRKGRENAPTLQRFSDADGPSTVYLGRRISDRFARIYDKRAESTLAHYNGCVRYEVELKRRLAHSTVLDMLAEPALPGPTIRRVYTSLVDRGCVLRWPRAAALQLCCPRTRSSAGRRLVWLAEAVRGPLQQLIEDGFHEEAARALGVSALIPRAVSSDNETMDHMVH